VAIRRLAALTLLAACLWAPRVSAQRALEYEVKAAYLYNIVNFVTWPADAFDGPTAAVRICVYGTDPFGPLLDRAIQGGGPGQRPMVAVRVAEAGSLTKCHLIFLQGGNTDRVDQAIRASMQRPILIVGESDDVLRRGGTIAFVIDAGRVRFDVNPAAATSRGLALSSRLLQVARAVVGKGRPS
jgi:hypothetical protein